MNQDLDLDAVSTRTAELNATYTKVGQLLSDVDLEFVRIYGTTAAPAGDIVPFGYAGYDYNKSATWSGGSGNISGHIGINLQDPGVNHSWNGSVYARGYGNVTSIKSTIHVRAYGLVGPSGIGLVYSTDPTQTVSGQTHNFVRSGYFTAIVVYATISADSIFYVPGGSYQINS